MSEAIVCVYLFILVFFC